MAQQNKSTLPLADEASKELQKQADESDTELKKQLSSFLGNLEKRADRIPNEIKDNHGAIIESATAPVTVNNFFILPVDKLSPEQAQSIIEAIITALKSKESIGEGAKV